MSHPIRILFIDIDGTIFDDRRVIPSARRAIEHLLQRGDIEIALCTGRSTLHARPVVEALGVRHAVYFNGALVHSDGQVVHATSMAPDTADGIRDFAAQHRLPAVYHTDDEAWVLDKLPENVQPVLDAFAFPPLKLLPEGRWRHIRQRLFQANLLMTADWDLTVQRWFPECLLYRWAPRGVDLQIRGSDKSLGARALLEHLQLPPAAAAHVGDGGNDVGMFHLVGHSVAMGNAPRDVQRQAQYVSRSVDEDGFVHALELLRLL